MDCNPNRVDNNESFLLRAEGFSQLQQALLTFRLLQTSPNHTRFRSFFAACGDEIEQVIKQVQPFSSNSPTWGRDFPTTQQDKV